MFFHKTLTPLRGELTVPGDKSISHRAIMLGSIADGTTEVTNFLQGADCLSTIGIFRQLGVKIINSTPSSKHSESSSSSSVIIHGKGLYGLKKPDKVLDVGNSGTTMRLISGILSGQGFPVTLTGDESIRKRPMGRIMAPLKMMGADIESELGNDCAPLLINSDAIHTNRDIQKKLLITDNFAKSPRLSAIHYISPVASAQIKSCVFLAGLYADGNTTVTEPALSRDHTERMLMEFGVKVLSEQNSATIHGNQSLQGSKIQVPGDISSAAYFIVAGLIVPNSELVIKNVGINPTRDGIIKVCQQMGGSICLDNVIDKGGEPVADIVVKHSELHGTIIEGNIIPTLIDEIPIIAVLACFAKGDTIIKDAAELKVKESNRIDVMVGNLSKMGADITATEDGMIIRGGRPLHGAVIESKSDHRIAMSLAIASLMAEGDTEIKSADCVDISYPQFYEELQKFSKYLT
ncbi:MAG: 3-phosphoshikimate 1-carboxyvinyltransferase [Clostridiales bacterium]|nr:3-phosphoshikimate 1-carboxyvinyltransferase [Clostridiales bacterium]